MAKAEAFYHTQAWKDTRIAYIKSVGGLCEDCLAKGIITPGEIVHHRIHLDADNMNDPSVALDWSNLKLVCRECHAAEHPEIYGKARHRYKADPIGRIEIRG